MCHEISAHGKRRIIGLTAGLLKVCGTLFLRYDAKLIRSGYAPTEAMLGRIRMQVECGVAKREPLEGPVGDVRQRYPCAPMRMETRSIVKSLFKLLFK